MRGDRLRQVREQRQISQRRLAAKCGIGEKQIWRYEMGESEPTSGHLSRIAQELTVSADYLLGLTDEYTLPFSGQALRPDEIKLISDLRQGRVVEALDTFNAIAKRLTRTPQPRSAFQKLDCDERRQPDESTPAYKLRLDIPTEEPDR